MSVWKAACYRDDTFHALTQWFEPDDLDSDFVRSLLDFDVEDSGHFRTVEGLVPGNLRALVDSNPGLLKLLHDPVRRFDPDVGGLVELSKSLGEADFGLHGVYRLIGDHWNDIFRADPLTREERDFYSQLYTFGAATSYRTARECADRAASSSGTLGQFLKGPLAAVRALIRIGTFASGQGYRRAIRTARLLEDPYPEVECRDARFLDHYHVYWWKGVTILRHKLSDRCIVLLKNDVERFERLVLGLAWSNVYLAEYSTSDKGLNDRLKKAYNELKGVIRDVLSHVSKRNANLLCRAFDVCVWYYLAGESRDVNDRAFEQQTAKIRTEKLGEILPIQKIMRIVRQFKMKEALELLQVYKAFPQPDFDYYGAANRQETMYRKEKTFGPERETEDTGSYEDFWRYHKYTMIRAYAKKHGICPGTIKAGIDKRGWRASYPHLPIEKIDPKHVDDIDITGCFTYNTHGTDILDLIKDKAICPKEIDNVKDFRDILDLPIEKKNQLMDILMRDYPVDVSQVIQHDDEIFDDVRAEDKPEAKKPNGRWFFEAGTERRLVQSEYEQSVADYAKSTVGCMAGKGTRDKIDAMNYVTELPRTGSEMFTRPFMISFDLDKFSPSLSHETHKRMDEQWADAFGMNHIAKTSDVWTRGKIHYIKRKIHHTFNKLGRDFEGFAGRKNTVYHCAVMGYCVRRLREMDIVPKSGRFVSLIDDGLLRLDLPIDGYDERVKRVLEVIEAIYNMCNLYISWDKTFVSSHFAVFLNEYYYDGTPVTPGIRAFLKISNRSDTLCPSILDDLGMLESTTRGAITAGTSPNLAYIAYAYGVMDLLRKWNKGVFKGSTKLALACFSPVALGGFGCVGMLAMSGSVTTNPLVEGIGNLRAIAVRFRHTAPIINNIVNQPMRSASPLEKLRAPLAVRREGRTLKQTRGKTVIERQLMNMIDTPVVRALVGNVSVRSTDSIVDAIPSFGRTSVEFLDSVWRSTIECVISNIAAKFLRARTAYKLVRRKSFFRAYAANMTEARALIAEWNRI
jgi:hypothetical protein